MSPVLDISFEAKITMPTERYPAGQVARQSTNAWAFRGAKPQGQNGYGASRDGSTVFGDRTMSEADALRYVASEARAWADRIIAHADKLEAGA